MAWRWTMAARLLSMNGRKPILTYLDLESNPGLSDIQPLLDNTGLGSGDEVRLRSTAVGCADVTALEANGVTVLSDCPW